MKMIRTIPAPFVRINTTDLQAALALRAEEVAQHLYPAGKRKGQYIEVGDIQGTPGKSFKVCIRGQYSGLARDWAGGEKACTLVDCYMAVKGVTFRAAAEALSSWMGIAGIAVVPDAVKVPVKPVKPLVKREEPKPWPTKARAIWAEGLSYSRAHLSTVAAELAVYRGWDQWSCERLIDGGVLAQIQWYGERCWALPSRIPKLRSAEWVNAGLHIRNPKHREEEYGKWQFITGSTSAPFVIGRPSMSTTWIITEGQWDAISIAMVASPPSSEPRWLHTPPHRCADDTLAIIGIRGAHNWRSFINIYGERLNAESTCILIPDADKVGMEWADPDGFIATLSGMANTRAYRPPCQANDCNDALRAGDLTHEVVQLWLKGGVA